MSPAAPVEAVLFDAAGTLIELAAPLGETYADEAGRHGVKLPAWRLQDAFGRVFRSAPPMLFPDAAPGEVDALERGWWRGVVRSTFLAADSTVRFADFDAFFEALYAHYAEPSAWRARTGAEEALATLEGRGIARGVLSNFDGRLPRILEGLGLARWLPAVVLPAQSGALKPDPKSFAAGLARLGATASHTVFVGDDPEDDLAGARAVGLRVIDVGSLATLALLPERLVHLEEPHP